MFAYANLNYVEAVAEERYTRRSRRSVAQKSDTRS